MASQNVPQTSEGEFPVPSGQSEAPAASPPTPPSSNSGDDEDWLAKDDALLASMPLPQGPRLTFSEQCAIAASLLRRESTDVLMRTFDVSQTTVSKINAAVRSIKPPRYYGAVRDEFIRLGRDDFIRTYLTREIFARIVAQRVHRPELAPNPQANLSGPNPAASKFVFAAYGAFSPYGRAEEHLRSTYRIDWLAVDVSPDLHQKSGRRVTGWFFRHCQPNGEPWTLSKVPPGEEDYIAEPYIAAYGREWAQGYGGPEERVPFHTSAQAFDAVYEYCGLESPRPKPGRPRKNQP